MANAVVSISFDGESDLKKEEKMHPRLLHLIGYKWAILIVMFFFALQMGVSPAFADGSTVKEVQQSLADKGFDPGAVDGIMGPKTRGALKKFQESAGLAATGKIDSDTRSHLLGAMHAGASHEMPAPASSRPMSADVPDSEIVWGPHKPR